MAPPPTLGMILKGYPRISETFISNEILRLEEQGMPVRIFSMRHPRENFTHASVQRIRARVDYLPTELLQEFPRLFMPTALLAVREPGRFRAALATAGRRFQRSRNLATVKHLLQAGYLVEHLLRHAPEVVHLHAHFAHSPTSVALFASLLSGLGFSFTAHAKDIYTANPEQLREKIRLASLVLTCTGYNRAYLQRIADAATPIHCVYHGIDLGLFDGPGQRPAPRPPYRILTVARLTAKKGIPTILAALARLREQGVDFRYTLIGDGDDRDRVMDRIFELGLQGHCRWPGVLPHEQVIGEFARADLFVLGCTIAGNGDRDGIPNVLVESLAMGLPAVATRVSALPEIIHDNTTGLLVPPDDPAAMAEAMLRMLTDGELRRRAIRQGRELVAARFDNRRLIDRLAAIYRDSIPALACR
ncbi:MAG TPA: colanic acid biosynthesis glycosyltransferase WcaL [Desulfobulbus sp.]|nr:colanic acid biosynthesis glycosyltransferase WcaL [Desulfobulbus sp.]